MEFKLREMYENDWEQVSVIYKQGMDTGNCTFESNVPDYEYWNNAHLKENRIVAYINDEILGWAALSPASKRKCYSGVVEVSLYIKDIYRGEGIGSTILKELIRQSEENNIWTIYGSIFEENVASRNLFKKFEFIELGIREKIAKDINGRWRNTVFIERRSKNTKFD